MGKALRWFVAVAEVKFLSTTNGRPSGRQGDERRKDWLTAATHESKSFFLSSHKTEAISYRSLIAYASKIVFFE